MEAALLEALEERPSVGFGLGDHGAEAQDRASAVLPDAAGDQDGARDDRPIDPDFFVHGVQDKCLDAADRPVAPLDISAAAIAIPFSSWVMGY